MIKVSCHTNLDLFNEVWPTELPAVPRVGDEIESATKHGEFQLSLQVVKVRYEFHKHPSEIKGRWIPVIELHMADWMRAINKEGRIVPWSITDFYNWYAPKIGGRVSDFI